MAPSHRFSLQGIRGRLVLLLLAVLVPVLLTEAVLYTRRLEAQKAEELQANLEVARAVGKSFATFVQDFLHSEYAIGLALTAARPLTDPDRERLLERFLADNPTARVVLWLSPAGRVLAASPRNAVGIDVGDRSYIQAIRTGREWALSELIPGRATGKPGFAISRAIRDTKGSLAGIVAIFVEPDRLDHVVGVARAEDAGVSLIDQNGIHVYRYPRTPYTTEQRNWLQVYPVMKGALEGKDVLTTVRSGVTGKNRLVAFTPVPELGWVAAASRAEADVTSEVRRSLLLQAGLALCVILTGVAGALAVARPIARSVVALRSRAEALARGEATRVEVMSGPSELHDLAATFNEMAEAVRAREAALHAGEERYRALFRSGMDAVVLTDPTGGGRVLEVNPAACELFGYTAEEFRGLSRAAILDLRDARVAALVATREATGRANEQLTYKRKDGTSFIGEATTALFNDREGHRRAVTCIRDVTDRKRAEEALRLSEEKFSKAFESNPACLTLSRLADGTFLEVNDTFLRLFGFRREEVIGRTSAELGTWQRAEDRADVVAELVARGTIQERELAFRTKGGGELTASLSAEVLRVGGDPLVLASFIDITERKRAEAALRASEERYRQLFASMTEGFVLVEPILDAGGSPVSYRVLDANPALERLTHLTRAEIIGKDVRDVLGLGEPYWVETFGQVARTGTPAHIEEFSEALHGWYDVYVYSPEPGKVAFIYTNVTARKRTEEALRQSETRYRMLHESLRDAFVQVTMEGRIVDCNDAYCQMLGYTREELFALTYQDLTPERWHAFESRIVHEQIIARGYSEVYEKEYRRKDGRIFPVELRTILARDAEGRPSAMWGIVRDITERKRTEEALRAMLAQKEAALATNQALLREVHHRVKNNLQMLCDLMYLQMEAMPDRDQHQDLQDAYSRIYAIARLHEQLYQSMESGQIQLGKYLERLAAGFANVFGSVPVKVDAETDGVSLDIDRAIHVGLIVNELLTNAMKHAFPKGRPGEVVVVLRTLDEQVQLHVRDNGRGLPPDLNLEHAKSVGLRTVYILAKRLNAMVDVGNHGGTSFTLTFPKQADEPVEPRPE